MQSTLTNYVIPRSDRIKQLIKLCANLTDAEVTQICKKHGDYLGKLSEHFVPFGWEKCDSCHKYVKSLNEDVEAYKDYREDVCYNCVEYCGICERPYQPSGNYKNEECT